jgi:hypothetical protein
MIRIRTDRAETVVRRVKPGSGLGLRFTALTEEGGPRLKARFEERNAWDHRRITNP